MAPRFAFRSSKFRNVEYKSLPSFDQLHVCCDSNVLTATSSSFAFAHQMDSGGAIQVKLLHQTGKETLPTPSLVRAHATGRVTALKFSPFHENLLLSAGGADNVIKLWNVPVNEPMTKDLVTPLMTFQETTPNVVVDIVPHPSADSIVASYSRPGTLRIYDIEVSSLSSEVTVETTAALSSAAWNWDGSHIVLATQDQAVRILDPRIKQVSTPAIQAAHTGKKHLSVLWCGRTQHFLTSGSDLMHEREFKLWDPRQLAKCVHRERLDAGNIGHVIPLYDVDLDLLYVLGKGDRSVRLFEVDLAHAPCVQRLNHSALETMTLAATMLPKVTCDTNACEVARVLNLGAGDRGINGSCDVVSYRVPRKEATHTFQSDLYPDTLAMEASMTSVEWQQGRNAEPQVQTVAPTVKDVGDLSVSGHTTTGSHGPSIWGAPASNTSAGTNGWQTSSWGQALSSTASSNAPLKSVPDVKTGWRSNMRKWNDPELSNWSTPPVQSISDTPAAITAPISCPASWTASETEKNEEAPSLEPATTASDTPSSEAGPLGFVGMAELSDKAQRLSAKYGHKLKYLQGKESLRNDVFHFGDMRVAFSTQASSVIAANAVFWAAPIAGAGGPVLVEKLGATGKAQHGKATVINGHRAEVSALVFNPFNDSNLATGSADSTIQIWSLNSRAISEGCLPLQTLLGHTKGIRSLEYNPAAADVLCSSSHDLSLRFWDIEAGQEKLCLRDKLDDITWNMSFSQDGALLATASRAKILHVFDPRQQALVAMGCGYESNKPQFVKWVDSTHLLTLGMNSRNETQVSFWDARNLSEPLRVPVMVEPAASAASITTPIPLYDESSHLLFLVGTGSRHIWSYEVDPVAATVQANLPFMMSGTSTINGVALLPKTMCDIRNVELARLLVASPSDVRCVSFSLPRANKLKEFFQDDVYALVPKQEPSVTAAKWFMGESGTLTYESLCPDGMVALSKKPKESASARPKTLEFQMRQRIDEEMERKKNAQFARLSNLAAQPSLHSTHRSENNLAAPSTGETDSDDDWDE
ncbi:putative coronin, WD40/YVTN repeat-like-containing domain superfamily [Plasmopara halstedii]